MKFYDNELDVTVTEVQTQKENIDGIFETVISEYGLDGLSPEEVSEVISSQEYSNIFFENAGDFIDGYEISVTDSKGRLLGKVSINDFNIEEMNFYITDLYKAMDSISKEYGKLFSMLYKIGYDYETDYYILPEFCYISDVDFKTKDDDERYLVIEGFFAYLRRRYAEDYSRKNFLLAYIMPDDYKRESERFIMRTSGFRAIPETELLIADFQI